MTSPAPGVYSIRDHIARLTVKNAVALHAPITRPGPPPPPGTEVQSFAALGREPPLFPLPDPTQATRPICIIGAGAAGLYAAMILKSLNLPFEILEANPERVGGRLYTYRFNGEVGRKAKPGDPARYDYVDMGGMRFPVLGFHKRVRDLFHTIKIDNLVINYIMNSDNTIMRYNDISLIVKPANEHILVDDFDIFEVSKSKGGFVPTEYLLNLPKDGRTWIKEALGPYVESFRRAVELTDPVAVMNAITEAWKKVTAHDSLSTRAYMTRPDPNPRLPYHGRNDDYPEYSDAAVAWLESLNTSTGLYDQAFVESVIDAVDFGDWSPKTSAGMSSFSATANVDRVGDWNCIDGGSDRIITGMLDYLGDTNQPKLGQRVTGIHAPTSDGGPVEVAVLDHKTKKETRETYSQVICTVPLGCLASVDMSSCNLSFAQKTAIRALYYDASTKVAMKFKTRWWQDTTFMRNNAITGGISTTDLPIRTVVYPSYGVGLKDAPGSMIASYTWAQDARRMGSIADPQDPEIKRLVLRDLSTLHGVELAALEERYVAHFTHAWYNDPNARGAFALYGPGQFGRSDKNDVSLFASLKAPAAQGRLHFAGEATSIHHAWVFGALNSAWRAVWNALMGDTSKELRRRMEEKWEIPDEEDVDQLDSLYALGWEGKI